MYLSNACICITFLRYLKHKAENKLNIRLYYQRKFLDNLDKNKNPTGSNSECQHKLTDMHARRNVAV